MEAYEKIKEIVKNDIKRESKDYMKEYYLKNKERFNVKVKCETCGRLYKKSNKSNHIKTKNHELGELKIKLERFKNNLETMKNII